MTTNRKQICAAWLTSGLGFLFGIDAMPNLMPCQIMRGGRRLVVSAAVAERVAGVLAATGAVAAMLTAAEDEAGMGMSRSAASSRAMRQAGGADGRGELVKAWG